MRVEVNEVAWSVRGRTIIEDIDALFEPGTFTGLLGPNGSSKTTLLNVVAGLRSPGAGEVRVDGEDLHAMRSKRRAHRVALVEQHATTNLDLSVREVVELVAALHGLDLAAAYCDRLVVLQHGHIVAAGSVAEVLTKQLLAEVYGVAASVTEHPVTRRPHVVWHGTTGSLDE